MELITGLEFAMGRLTWPESHLPAARAAVHSSKLPVVASVPTVAACSMRRIELLRLPSKLFSSFWCPSMRDLSDDQLRQVYMDHCARLMSMQKLFRHNPDAKEVEALTLQACFALQKILQPHMTMEETETLENRIRYAQA